MAALLQVDALSAGYGHVRVLDNVSLHVNAGEFVSVVGANGAGKTTLLLSIARHLKITAGSIQFAGEPIQHLPSHDVSARGMSLVPEGGRLFPFMSVLENLELGAYNRQCRGALRANLDRMMTLFPRLRERRTQQAGSLSGGERQMCAIARALMGMPKILVLDEPSLGLAPVMIEQVFDLLKRLVAEEQMTLLLVEQNVGDALSLCDRAYVLDRGAIVKSGAGSALLGDPDVQRAYLGT